MHRLLQPVTAPRVAFELLDASQRGHRSILVFFLVDPTQRVLSTQRVPPQQAKWMEAGMEAALSQAVPVRELRQLVRDYVDWPMTDDEACRHREELMRERKFFVARYTDVVLERPFSLCEH